MTQIEQRFREAILHLECLKITAGLDSDIQENIQTTIKIVEKQREIHLQRCAIRERNLSLEFGD